MDASGNRPMNMATHSGGSGGNSGGGNASATAATAEHPPQYMSPPPTTTHLYLPPPTHLTAPAGGTATYAPTSAAAAVGVQDILNLAAASTRDHPAFPGLPAPHQLQAVVQQQQAHQVAVQVAQQVHQQQGSLQEKKKQTFVNNEIAIARSL